MSSNNYYHCYACGYHKDFTDEQAKNDDFCLMIRRVHQEQCEEQNKLDC